MVKIGCGQSGLWSLKLTFLKSEHMELTDFLHAYKNSCKLKGDSEFLGWALSKIGVASLVMGL